MQASVFVQSHVRAHVELMWLLSSATPIGWLNKMIQFKEKSRKVVHFIQLYGFTIYFHSFSYRVDFPHPPCYFTIQGDENVGVALLTYPVLMASDILLYQVQNKLMYY